MAELLARDIMTRKVITIGKDATVSELVRRLLRYKISGVPIVNEKNELIGIVSEEDIIIKISSLPFPISFSYAFLDNFESYTKSTKEFMETRVEDIMSKKIKTAGENMTLSKVVNIMINNNINRIPIVDEKNKLTGIITRADVMSSMIKKAEKNKNS